jgi:hypothetical protein
MQWYYAKNSNQLGPISDAELLSKISSGEVLPSDMVWREGLTDWVAASSVPELVVSVPGIPQETTLRQMPGMVQPTPYAPPGVSSSYVPGMVIPNYLWQSIVVTIFCCWPCGIPAIVYSAKVDGLKNSGNIQAAIEASANAKKWCFISLFSWIGIFVIYAIFAIIVAVSQS